MRRQDIHNNYSIVETVNTILTIKHVYPEFYGYVYYINEYDVTLYRNFLFERKDNKIQFALRDEHAVGSFNTPNGHINDVTFTSIAQDLYTRLTQ